MKEDEHIQEFGRTYESLAQNDEALARDIQQRIVETWGDTQPDVGDLVIVTHYEGFVNPCCGYAPERFPDLVGQICEVAVTYEYDAARPLCCDNCRGCSQHYHIAEGIFRFGVCRPGDRDGGSMVALHEIRPVGANWGLDGINLDPEATVDVIE